MTVASGYDAPGALTILADAEILGATLKAGTSTSYDIAPGHSAYLVPSTGIVNANRSRLEMLSGLVIKEEASITIEALTDAELLPAVTADVS